MSEHDDSSIGDALRELRPPRTDGYLAPGDDPAADSLLARLTASRPSGRTRRRRWIGGGLDALTLAGAGSAAAIILTREPDNPTVISCYSDADVASADVVGLSASSAGTPTERCEPFWSDGTFETQGPPPLAECITDREIIAVVPGEPGVCQTIGWADATPRTGGEPPPAATDLAAELTARFAGECHDLETATRLVNDIFDQLGLSDWTVETNSNDTTGCFAPGIEPGQTVALGRLPDEG